MQQIDYMDSTGTDTRMYHQVIMAAIKNDGVFEADFADVFILTKAPEGSAVKCVLNFA